MTTKEYVFRQQVQVAAYDLIKHHVAAQIFAAIWYWMPRAKTTRHGLLWVVKTDVEFIHQDGVTGSTRTIRSGVRKLIDAGMVEVTYGPHPKGYALFCRYVRITDDYMKLFGTPPVGKSKKKLGSDYNETDYV